MTVNSSAGLCEYYSKRLLNIYKSSIKISFEKENECDEVVISADLGTTNSTTTYIRRNASGETFPLFKSNVVNSGYPSAILMKNAFNLDVD